jgi:hypothetical protein
VKTLLALWLCLLGIASGKSVYTAEPPLGNSFVRSSEAIRESPPETLDRTRDFDPSGWDGTPETRYCHNDPVNNVDVLGLEAVPVEPVLRNGIPTMIYKEWAGSGLAYLWNALAAGKVKTWEQAPNAGEMANNYYQENGVWKLHSEGARSNAFRAESIARIPGKMQEIKPVMEALEIGGAAIAAAPVIAASGSAAITWAITNPIAARTYTEAAILIGGGAKGYDGVPNVFSAANKATKSLPLPNDLPKNIHMGQQGKHIRGHNNFIEGRSYLNEGVDANSLLEGVHAGKHPIVGTGTRGNPIVDFGKSIGVDGRTGQAVSHGQIHFGQNGAHIVPDVRH